VPAELLGDWFLGPPASVDFMGNDVCPSPPTGATCFVQMTFTAMTYHQSTKAGHGGNPNLSVGNVVVNNTEIDFFNEVNREGISDCDRPGGVGRYTWTVAGGILRFTLISEPCSGTQSLPNQMWSRTH
jgi:hypothetical protein